MRQSWIGLLLAVCVGCEVSFETAPLAESRSIPAVSPYADLPPVDLPVQLRQANYAGGSCMHASLISLLRWQEQHQLATSWRRTHSGGASLENLATAAERAGFDYAFTDTGDTDFLEWCSATDRGAVIYYFSNHAITFCGFVGDQAVLLDNNSPSRLLWIDKADFLRRWRGYGGNAFTPLFSPGPPRPWIVQSFPPNQGASNVLATF